MNSYGLKHWNCWTAATDATIGIFALKNLPDVHIPVAITAIGVSIALSNELDIEDDLVYATTYMEVGYRETSNDTGVTIDLGGNTVPRRDIFSIELLGMVIECFTTGTPKKFSVDGKQTAWCHFEDGQKQRLQLLTLHIDHHAEFIHN
jgi:hypothetical protein